MSSQFQALAGQVGSAKLLGEIVHLTLEQSQRKLVSATFGLSASHYAERPVAVDCEMICNITKFVPIDGPIRSIFDYVTLFAIFDVLNGWSNPALFQSGWFVETLLTEFLIICTAKIPLHERWASPALIATTIIVAMIVPSYAVMTQQAKSWFIRRS